MDVIKHIKRKNIFNRIYFATIVLFLIGVLVGCSKNNPIEPETTAKVAGKVFDESETRMGIKDASVRLVNIGFDGSEETISTDDEKTDSEGKFILETNFNGISNLLVKANKDGREWRGILTANIQPGIAIYMQPLTNVTTVSADLYMTALNSNISLPFTQIRILIDAEIAAILDSNKNYNADVITAVKTGFDTEEEIMLRPEIGGTTSQWQQILDAKNAAQSALDRDLYFARTENTEQIAFHNYICYEIDAYVDAGMQTETFSKVLEASLRSFLKKIEGLNSRLYFDLLKRSSEIRARTINVAVQSQFQKLGADPSIINKVIYTGEDFENHLRNVQSEIEILNEFENYQNEVLEYFIKVLGVNGNSIPAIEENISTLRNDLKTEVNKSADQGEIINAYVSFYTQVKNLVEQQTNSGNKDATAELLILVNMYF
jgi:hypothetical protein